MNDLDIEVNIGNDYFSGQEDFKSNLHALRESDKNKIGLYQYIDYGNFKKIELWDLCTIDRKKTLKKPLLDYALSEYYNYWTKSELRRMTKDELADLIENYMNEAGSDLDEWLEFAEESNITIGADSFKFYKTIGYSQGDIAEWCIRISDLEEFKNGDTTLKPYIDKLFWDAPISYSLTVDGEDYYIVEYVKDIYEYDKEEVYGICKELFKNNSKREYILGYIKGSLPECPKSSY